VSYNDDFNLVVKYMPSTAHEISHTLWINAFSSSLRVLASTNIMPGLGYIPLGGSCMSQYMLNLYMCLNATLAFELSPNKSKQADATIAPSTALDSPTVVLEVGDSESFTQLKIDARQWLESENLNVR
jgi:hypothetical protein